MNGNILIIDDEVEVRTLISGVLSDEGYNTLTAADEAAALVLIKKQVPDLIFLDLWIGDDESAGIKVLEKIRKMHFDIPVVIISGHGNIDIAVRAIQNGAFDFIEKPFVIDRLLLTSKRAIEMYRLKKENATLKNSKLDMDVFSVGISSFTSSIKSIIEKLASSNSRVFIKSCAGMGVDSIAFAIHKKSARKDQRFIYVSCISDSKENMDAELFGTEKSYGCIEKAHGGTIFLEDVARIPKDSQRKLLAFLQEGRYSVGDRVVYSDVRIISSSANDSMTNMLSADQFNRDLFYRLNIVSMHIPSLAERREDILPIVDYYISKSEQLFGLRPKKFTDNSRAILQSFDWPGNIYQVKNVVESSLINSSGSSKTEIDEKFLPPELTSSTRDKFDSLNIAKFICLPIKEAKESFEADYLRAQIGRFSGNVSQTANFIGMERSALHRKLKNLNVKNIKKKMREN